MLGGNSDPHKGIKHIRNGGGKDKRLKNSVSISLKVTV